MGDISTRRDGLKSDVQESLDNFESLGGESSLVVEDDLLGGTVSGVEDSVLNDEVHVFYGIHRLGGLADE